MNIRLSNLLITGLCVLMSGLFIAAFWLNRSQYTASISSVEASYNTLLKQQEKNLHDGIVQQEKEQFAHHKTHRELVVDLFIIRDDRVVPACTRGLLERVSKKAAYEAFLQGIARLPDHDALPYFQTAAKQSFESPDELYRKVGAYFNMLELNSTIQTVCCILALLDRQDVRLPESQILFFNNLLQEQVQDLEQIKARTSNLWETAYRIDQQLLRKKGAYRAAINGKILSVNEEGLALLYTPNIEATPPIQLTNSIPSSMHEEIIPGQVAFIPDEQIEEAKRTLHKQYHTGNGILGLMIVLGCGLAGGMFVSARRQSELDTMKTEFIATVSHELRTPLSLIRLHAETLHHGRIPADKIDDYHQTILTEAERLSGIVNNVLDFSRMERGKLQIHPEPTDLSALCERIAGSFQGRLQQNGFVLEKQIHPDISATVDPLAFSQIIFNLLDNAIKYSDGEKCIRIELERSDGWIILHVFDRGIGIPDKLKKHIFDDFVRSDDPKVTARRGSGIGLSVARRLVEQMNGTIQVEDHDPVGSVFIVSVPPASSRQRSRQDGGDTIEE
jgi:signal transduction histidine kinase